jgi:hypothetical protein
MEEKSLPLQVDCPVSVDGRLARVVRQSDLSGIASHSADWNISL